MTQLTKRVVEVTLLEEKPFVLRQEMGEGEAPDGRTFRVTAQIPGSAIFVEFSDGETWRFSVEDFVRATMEKMAS